MFHVKHSCCVHLSIGFVKVYVCQIIDCYIDIMLVAFVSKNCAAGLLNM